MEEKYCGICKERIDTKIEDWCMIIDYQRESEMCRKYYHIRCYKEIFKRRMEKMNKMFLQNVSSIIPNVLKKLNIVGADGTRI